jgi:hypothetical protein
MSTRLNGFERAGPTAAATCEAASVDVEAIAEAAGVELRGKLPHGEGEGAFLVRTPDRTDAVLKIVAGEAPYRPMIDALRRRGYPAPSLLAAGEVGDVQYEVIELMAGTPLASPTAEHVRHLVACNELQRDVGIAGRGPFVEEMVRSLVDGLDGYCEHDALRAHDPDLLDRLRRIGDATTDVSVPTDDVVHYDFSPLNILADGPQITGVVDWQGATNGDATFDLITLAYYTYDAAAHTALLRAAYARSDPRALQLYAGHVVLRQVDWTLRHHDELSTQWHRDLGLALLSEVGAG